jgi:hypothetical protein
MSISSLFPLAQRNVLTVQVSTTATAGGSARSSDVSAHARRAIAALDRDSIADIHPLCASLYPRFLSPSFSVRVPRLQQQLSAYESGAEQTQQHESSIHHTLEALARTCAEMDIAANNEGARRDTWKQSVCGAHAASEGVESADARAREQRLHSRLHADRHD